MEDVIDDIGPGTIIVGIFVGACSVLSLYVIQEYTTGSGYWAYLGALVTNFLVGVVLLFFAAIVGSNYVRRREERRWMKFASFVMEARKAVGMAILMDAAVYFESPMILTLLPESPKSQTEFGINSHKITKWIGDQIAKHFPGKSVAKDTDWEWVRNSAEMALRQLSVVVLPSIEFSNPQSARAVLGCASSIADTLDVAGKVLKYRKRQLAVASYKNTDCEAMEANFTYYLGGLLRQAQNLMDYEYNPFIATFV